MPEVLLNENRQRAKRLRLARWLMATAIFGSAMAIGGVHVPVLLAALVVLAAATAFAWWGAGPLRTRRSASLVLWTAVALTVWTALAVVPLPVALLAHLSPHAADIWAGCLAPLGLPGPTWATLSLDPGATSVQVLRGVVYVLAFATASRIAARREGVVFLERAVLVTGLALAAAAIIHPALGAEKVFGIYTPRNAPGLRHVAPILNANVLSGYLNIALALILGQLLSPRSQWPRSILAALVVALVGEQVWIASRGGLLGTAAALVLVTWMSRSTAPDKPGRVRSLLVPGLLVLCGVGMAVVASSEQAMGELATAEVSKLDVIREAFHLVGRFPLFGVGRGAFESVFPAVRTDPTFVVYAHPENVIAQWTTEWGVVVASVALVVLLFALRPSSAMARSPRAAGAWGALACVAMQNLVDFGSEYPAVVIALATCAAVVTGGSSGLDTSSKLDAWARRPAVLVAFAMVASVVGVVLVIPGFGHEVFDERVALRASALDPNLTRAEFEHRAEAAMLRHPAEPFLPFTGALRAARVGDVSPLPWIERTLDRAVVYGPAHMLLARWLTRRSPSQARLECRLTLEQAPELAQYVAPAIAGLVHGYDDATEVLPRGVGRAGWIEQVSVSVAPKLPATARRLDDLDAVLDPDDARRVERRAKEALADVLAGDTAPWCAGERRVACIHKGLALATRLTQLTPTECAGYAIHARLVLENGDPALALKEFGAAAASVADRTACFEQLADLAVRAGSDEAVTHALDRIVHAGCVDDAECVRNLEFVAAREVARGNERSALAVLQRARERAPDDDRLVEQVAALAAKVDLHVESLRAYQVLAQRHPTDPRWAAAIDAEKQSAVESSMPH
jgi:hypothetical protein